MPHKAEYRVVSTSVEAPAWSGKKRTAVAPAQPSVPWIAERTAAQTSYLYNIWAGEAGCKGLKASVIKVMSIEGGLRRQPFKT